MAPFFPRFKGIAVERWNRCRERKHLLRGTTITRIEDHPLIPPVGRGHLQHDDSPPGFAEEAQRLHGKRVIGLTFAFVLSWKLTSLSLSAIFVVNRFRGAILADVTQRPRNFTVLRLLDSTRGAWMGSILIGFGCEISRAIASSPKTFFFFAKQVSYKGRFLVYESLEELRMMQADDSRKRKRRIGMIRDNRKYRIVWVLFEKKRG